VRLTQELSDALDKKRIELQPAAGRIPTRSDVVRYALELYLTGSGQLGPTEEDRRRS